jgi:hypothetical protein
MKQAVVPLLIATALLAPTLSTSAETDQKPRPDKGPGLTVGQTTREQNELFDRTRPQREHDNVEPIFTIADRQSRFMMQIGGYVKPIIGWDMGNVLDNISFIPANIPAPVQPGQHANFFVNPLHSKLAFQILGMPGSRHEVGAYIQLGYDAAGSAVKIHYAYVTFADWTLGRVPSLFEDGEAIPNTIDPQGPNGAVSNHAYGLSYKHRFANGVGVGIGIEVPTYDRYSGKYWGKDYPDLDGVLGYGNASQPVPDVPMYVEYRGRGNNRVRLSGIVRDFNYYDEHDKQTESRLGWGVQLSGNLQPVRPLTLYYECTYGKGIGYYIQDISCLTVSYLPSDNRPGKMDATPMMGWLAGFSLDLPRHLTLSGVYSQARVWDAATYASNYRYGQYVEASLLYSPRKYITFGVEYLYGARNEFTKTSGHLNRAQGMLQFKF